MPLNLPLNVPNQPAFGREPFQHEIKVLAPGLAYDDKYTLNTQSGTQWDGFRHFAHFPSMKFYNGTTGQDVQGPDANNNCSIHHWAEHGIAGRGVLLDYWTYANEIGIGKTYGKHTCPFFISELLLTNQIPSNAMKSPIPTSTIAAKPKELTFVPPPKAATSRSATSYSSAPASSKHTTTKTLQPAQQRRSVPMVQAKTMANAGQVLSKKKP